jgi:hypothetical protein
MLVPNDEEEAFSGRSQAQTSIMFTRPSTNDNLSLLGSTFVGDEDMARQFSVPRATVVQLRGYAIPQPSIKLEQLLDEFTPKKNDFGTDSGRQFMVEQLAEVQAI